MSMMNRPSQPRRSPLVARLLHPQRQLRRVGKMDDTRPGSITPTSMNNPLDFILERTHMTIDMPLLQFLLTADDTTMTNTTALPNVHELRSHPFESPILVGILLKKQASPIDSMSSVPET